MSKKAIQKSKTKTEKPRKAPGDGKRALLVAVTSTLLGLLVAASVTACLSAVYIELHPEYFKADLTMFVPRSESLSSQLYYFPSASPVSPSDAAFESAEPLENGTLTGGEHYRYVPLSEIPETLRNAFIAIEDKRFYTHSGVDLRRTGAAVFNYLLKRDKSFGGSSITQQLIKNVTGESAKTPFRKLCEILRAADLERNLSKDEILEQYLNIVPLANGCIGVGAASARYFGKSPSDLTLAECASLAAITQNPTRYDPVRSPEENRTRRDRVLSELYLQGYITEEDFRTASGEAVKTVEAETTEERPTRQSWYADLVVSDVIGDLTRTYGYSRAEASRLLYHGGLKIYTLIDPDLQAITEDYYADASNFPRLENGKAPQSAIVVLDPSSGNLLAVAGAIGEKTGDRIYNFATDAKRPPGSVLKPLSVYAPALQDGLIGYASVYDDVPVRFSTDSNGSTAMWPHNASGVYRGLSTVNDAVSRSLNTVAVRVLQELGIDRSFRFLRDQLGITSLVDRGENGITDRGEAALALGQLSYGATLREITAAYTAFSNGGVYHNARTYLRVTDSAGRILLENEAVSRPVLSAENAAIMTKMLENVVKNGTARTLTLSDRVAVAGKTGTTQYSFDRWFVGYTPSLLTGVWYGYEYPESLAGIDGNPALAIFDSVMHALTDQLVKSEKPLKTAFSYPPLRTARVCADSGLLISDACTRDPRGDRSVLAYFTEGTVPTTFCTCHTDVPYQGIGSEESDGVLLPNSDAAERRLVGLVRVNRRFPIEVTVTDAQYSIPIDVGDAQNTSDPRNSFFYADAPPYAGRSNARFPFNRPAGKRKRQP